MTLFYLNQQLTLKCLVFLYARISVPGPSQVLMHHTSHRTKKSNQVLYHRIWEQEKSLPRAELLNKGKCTYWTHFLILKLVRLLLCSSKPLEWCVLSYSSEVSYVVSVLKPHFSNGGRIRTCYSWVPCDPSKSNVMLHFQHMGSSPLGRLYYIKKTEF